MAEHIIPETVHVSYYFTSQTLFSFFLYCAIELHVDVQVKLQTSIFPSAHLPTDQPTCSDSVFKIFIYKFLSAHFFIIYLFICIYIMYFIPKFSLAS